MSRSLSLMVILFHLQVLVKSLNLYGRLDGHEGCVNAVEFNSSGDLLVSGSDDRQVMLWNWASKARLLAYPSGHTDNIFQTKIMPFSGDCRIITSAGDGQVNKSVKVCIKSNIQASIASSFLGTIIGVLINFIKMLCLLSVIQMLL